MKWKERMPGVIYECGYVYGFHFHLIGAARYWQPVFTASELVNEIKEILLSDAVKSLKGHSGGKTFHSVNLVGSNETVSPDWLPGV